MLVDPSYFMAAFESKMYFWGCNDCHLTVLITVKMLSPGKFNKSCECNKWPLAGGMLENIKPVMREG